MSYTETWVKHDLKQLVNPTFLDGGLFCNDEESNLLGVELYDGKNPVYITGECVAIAILGDETTVTENGQIEGNKAFIVLPASFLTVAGPIQIAIRIDGATIGLFKGYVYRTATDDIVENEP